ncbi:hypothetical protein CBR_g6725 [Chara braunii]|uniref:B box-type domain-containing protein n=1 Tax=Chara braunii TaxID=69332 RepID=A0A388KKM4_CHABU|nr:hypothetical protein CBR_g6725 [Chara braunii]|eukprot:GBG70599.1 hypothetical protein CBR_g6725 [Chara braunii]
MEASEISRVLRAPHLSGRQEEASSSSSGRLGPSWLKSLLSASFFAHCSRHAGGHKSECNMFCIDCEDGALCSYCTSTHSGHRILQIRRSSYHDVVRVADIQKLLDVSQIQVYVINSARIVFLNGRPQSKPAKGSAYVCRTCHRSLLDSSRYCSLGCKLTGIKRQMAGRRTPTTTMMEKLQMAAGERGGDANDAGGGSDDDDVFESREDDDWAKGLTLQLASREHHHHHQHHNHHHHNYHNGYQRVRSGNAAGGGSREAAAENPYDADQRQQQVEYHHHHQQQPQTQHQRQRSEPKPCDSEESVETSRKIMNWRKRVLPPLKTWGNVREESGEGREESTEGEAEEGEVDERSSYLSVVPPSTPPQVVQDDRRVGLKRRKGTPHRAPLW